MQLIAQGAEARLWKDRGKVIKERLSKSYRLPQLDEALRKFRTRREAKILQKLEELNFPAPRLKEFYDQRMSLVMDFVPGEKLRDVLLRDVFVQGNQHQELAQEMGRKIGRMHAQHMVHGDLTTSNMIMHQETKEINLIDFGLSAFSKKVEDKAVDLFLLDRALESKHYHFYPSLFEQVIQGYLESYPEARKVLERFQQVKKRGRNKKKEICCRKGSVLNLIQV